MKYLTDRVSGRPQQMIGGNGTPVKIELQWTGSPEWLKPNVTMNQQVNHIITSADRAEEIPQFIDGQPRRFDIERS
jgi:hypothetical protein